MCNTPTLSLGSQPCMRTQPQTEALITQAYAMWHTYQDTSLHQLISNTRQHSTKSM